MKVWMRGRAAPRSASQARSISPIAARESPATDEFFTSLAISRTASKSPFEAIGKPASMTLVSRDIERTKDHFASWQIDHIEGADGSVLLPPDQANGMVLEFVGG